MSKPINSRCDAIVTSLTLANRRLAVACDAALQDYELLASLCPRHRKRLAATAWKLRRAIDENSICID